MHKKLHGFIKTYTRLQCQNLNMQKLHELTSLGLIKILLQSQSEWFYILFNSQSHIGTGPFNIATCGRQTRTELMICD